jgi:glycosyltransferase involved in cell wall biosynthesis
MSTNNTPLFVVVLPTYTRSELLIRALDSIHGQNYVNWKCIVVDDGSTDDTESVAHDFMAKDDRIVYVKQDNRGVNAARNTGIDLVSATTSDCYYIFIDDDDYLAEQCLVKASACISEQPSYSWYGFNCIDSATQQSISKIKDYGRNNYITDLMFGSSWRGDVTSFIHASIIDELRFCQEVKNGEEWYFWSQLAVNYDVFIKDEAGSFKDYLPSGLTKSGFNRDKAIQVLNLKLRILSPIVGERKMIHQIVTLAKNCYQQGQKPEARALLRKAFKLKPLYLRQYSHWIKQLFY